MKNLSLILMDMDTAFLHLDYQKQVIKLCTENNLKYGFITNRDYKSCLCPVNFMNLYKPDFLFSCYGNGLYIKSCSHKNYNPYMVDDNYSRLLQVNWPGTDTIIQLLKELDDCELVSSSQFYLSYYVPDIITLNAVEFILSAFNVKISCSSKLFLEIFPSNGGQDGCLNYLSEISGIPFQSIIIANSGLKMEETENYSCKRIVVPPYYRCEMAINHPGSDNFFTTCPGSRGVYEGLCFFLKNNPTYCFSKAPG